MDVLKRCGRCGEETGNFGPTSPRCRPCENARAKRKRDAWTPERKQALHRKQYERRKELGHYHPSRRYGLTEAEYQAHLTSPCDICGSPSEHLDHNHATGRVRGGLCSGCNLGLGHFTDDPARLAAAISYLEFHS